MRPNTDPDFLRALYVEFRGGRSKNDIEREEFDLPKAHGKWITAQWRKLGIETERPHPLVQDNLDLKDKVGVLEARIEDLEEEIRDGYHD